MIRFLIFLVNDRPKIFIRVWRVLVDINIYMLNPIELSHYMEGSFLFLVTEVQSFTIKIHA